jgi:prephenate dehydratase
VRRIGYLGPSGTFNEEALIGLIGAEPDVEAVSYPTIGACFDALGGGEVPEVLVPIENSIEGSVNQTLDQLAFGPAGRYLRGETVHRIHHHLIAGSPLALEAIERVVSHPHASAQCGDYLAATLPGATIVAANSTAEAVRTVCEENGRSAAIGPARAAELYGGVVLAGDIADRPDNHTRFVVVGREPAPATGAGAFKTSIVCALGRDRPGALLAILQEFAMRAVNLTKLESRPAKTSLGSYIFFIDIEGSRDRDLPVDAAIRAIEEQGVATVNFLGSFPAAGEPG